MTRIKGENRHSNSPQRGIQDDVKPMDADLSIEEIRGILSKKKAALGRPVNVLFLCLGGVHCSPLMKQEFEKTIQSAGLGDYLEVKKGGWDKLAPSGLAWADVALPIIVDVKGDRTAFPYALRNLTEQMSRPDIPEFIDFEVDVPVYDALHLQDAIRGKDYNRVLQQIVGALSTIQEDVTPKEPDLTLDEMRSILGERTNGGKDPVKVMFLCAKGDKISATMMRVFEALLSKTSLEKYFATDKGGMWCDDVSEVSDRIRGQDIVSSYIVKPFDSEPPKPLTDALSQIGEHKPIYVPVVVEHNPSGPEMLKQIENTDFNPFLQDVVKALKRE